jgi:hypothetical protein
MIRIVNIKFCEEFCLLGYNASLVKVKLCLGRAHFLHLQGKNACYHCENLKSNITLDAFISIILNKYVIKISLLRISLLLGNEYKDKHDFPDDGCDNSTT